MRIITLIGLVVLALLSMLIIVVSIYEHKWWDAFLATGFVSLIAFFADMSRVETLKRLRPEISTRPNRKIIGFFMFSGGVTLLVVGVNGLLYAHWWDAAMCLFMSAILLFTVFGEWSRGRPN